MSELTERYYVHLGAAFARGRLGDLPTTDDESAFEAGQRRGLKMHKFKRNADLPRVRRVLSMLAGLAPESLLDIGSGRGAFLWPLLDAFPEVDVTAIDKEERRAADFGAVASGGIRHLHSACMNATSLTYPDATFDGVTMLEVLEHMTAPQEAAREALRVARRFVVATVPSKEDDNPEHIQLFDRRTIAALFEGAGARRVTVEFVLNHMVMLALAR